MMIVFIFLHAGTCKKMENVLDMQKKSLCIKKGDGYMDGFHDAGCSGTDVTHRNGKVRKCFIAAGVSVLAAAVMIPVVAMICDNVYISAENGIFSDEGDVMHYRLGCGKPDTDVFAWDLNCGMSNGTLLETVVSW